MTSIIKEKPATVAPSRFPLLRQNLYREYIVLFSSECTGTVVHATDGAIHKLGDYFTTWSPCDESIWINFNNEIVLSN